MQSRLIRLIGVVFSNGAMLSVLDKYDPVNERTQEINELMKLHIKGCGKMPINLLGKWTHQQNWKVDCYLSTMFKVMHWTGFEPQWLQHSCKWNEQTDDFARPIYVGLQPCPLVLAYVLLTKSLSCTHISRHGNIWVCWIQINNGCWH